MIVGFFYVLTDPITFIAVNLYRAAVLARIVHTFAFVILPMQPTRAISYLICSMITAFMAIRCALFFM